jgi:phosphoribosyl 1,2-cyclic phosphodiesterase
MTVGTRIGLHERCVPTRIERVEAGRAFRAGAWTIEPFGVPHDTRDPVSYLLTRGHTTVGVLTDLGRSTRLVERQLARMSIAVLEFNHDLEMLMDGSYPWSLKQRVRGGHGHLSNAQAAELVRVAATSRLEHLVLAHLSEENNLPELALHAAQAALHDAGLAGVQVSVASQQLPLGPFRSGGPALTARRVPPRPRRRPTAAPQAPAAAAQAEPRQLGLFG